MAGELRTVLRNGDVAVPTRARASLSARLRPSVLAVLLLAACGGTSTGTPITTDPDGGTVVTNPDGGAPPAATVLKAGVYQAAPAITARSALAVGPAMATTLITEWGGSFVMVFPNYDFVRGVMTVAADGTLQPGEGNVLVRQAGGVEPAVIAGASDMKGSLVGTVRGSAGGGAPMPFSLALTTIGAQDFAVSKMVGSYISTSSSNGAWVVISIATSASAPEAGSILGYAYASQADALAVFQGAVLPGRNAVGIYYGSIIHTDAPVGSCSTNGVPGCAPTPNSFSIGFNYRSLPVDGSNGSNTGGFAYFTTAGLVALTVNQVTGEQLTAVFAKF